MGIAALGDLVIRSGYAGTWIYGILERALIPFGLHHVFYMPFWQTAVGRHRRCGRRDHPGRAEHLLCAACGPHR